MAFNLRTLFKDAFQKGKLCSIRRSFADKCSPEAPPETVRRGLILGVYSDEEGKEHKLTAAAQKFNSTVGGKLEELLREGIHLERGKTHMFQHLDPGFHSVAVVGLGKEDVGFNRAENIDECKETIRRSAARAARRLRRISVTEIHCEAMGHAESAAEGLELACYRFQRYKRQEKRKRVPKLKLYFDDDKDGWERGKLKGQAQNIARYLCDKPANHLTPAKFAQEAVDLLCPCGVNVEIRDKDWMENKKMFSLLAVARGSCEPPVLMELGYCGGPADEKPIVLVGKGITFDSGGLCIKKCRNMHKYKADMTGAAVVVAALRAAATLSLPLNIQAVIPVCENMPSGMAMKPGDIVTAMNGKSIRIDDTDNDGRLVLCDALVHASIAFKPRMIIDIASLAHGVNAALGGGATGVFTNNQDLWKQMEKAGAVTGDRVWRLPLWNTYRKKVKRQRDCDISNVGRHQGEAAPCRGAAFLRDFVSCGDWIHMDTCGTGKLATTAQNPMLTINRMTGRPTRTVIQFLFQMACPKSK